MEHDINTTDLYRICNALNTQANDLEKDAKSRRAKGHTFQQIDVVEAEAKALRDLSKRLITEKEEAEPEFDPENIYNTPSIRQSIEEDRR
jgi:hypothetical protein